MVRFIAAIIISVLLLCTSNVSAQYTKEGYRFEHKIKAPRVRKPIAHELMLDPAEKFLIVSYSSHPTVVKLYEFGSWETKATYNIPKWFDLSNSFMGPEGKYLFLDYARYSSKYRRIDLETNKIDTLECFETPRGCMPKEGGVAQKEVYTNNKIFFITINKKNKRDILIFKQQSE